MEQNCSYTYKDKSSEKIDNEELLQRFKNIRLKIEKEYLSSEVSIDDNKMYTNFEK